MGSNTRISLTIHPETLGGPLILNVLLTGNNGRFFLKIIIIKREGATIHL